MLNFEIAIRKHEATISRAPHPMALPLVGPFAVSEDRVEELLGKLEQFNQDLQVAIENPETRMRDFNDSQATQAIEDFGHELFETFFIEALNRNQQNIWFYLAQLATLAKPNEPARFQLHIDDPELWGLPWEFLYWQHQFLALSNSVLLVRQATTDEVETITLNEPLSMLVVFANPNTSEYPDLSREIEQERQALKQELSGLTKNHLLYIDFLDEQCLHSRTSTLRCLKRVLRQKNYHIIYYFGHGDIDDHGTSLLVLEGNQPDREGRLPSAQKVKGQALMGIIDEVIPDIGLVILNACWTAQNQKAAQNFRHNVLFGSVATSIFSSPRSRVAAVVAMPFPIGVDTAAQFRWRFFREFVRNLVASRPFEEAVAAVRRDICLVGNSIEGLFPVLFSRSRTGLIFNVNIFEVIRNLFNEAKALYKDEKYGQAKEVYEKLQELPLEWMKLALENDDLTNETGTM
jgi:hypothetical protein